MRTCELYILQHDEQIALRELSVMPTVCLMALHEAFDIKLMEKIVKDCLLAGVICFSTYGRLADSLEDQIDFVLESGNVAWLNIITTSHQNESIEDTAHFFVNAAYRTSSHFRCLVIYDCRVKDWDILLQEVRKLCNAI